MALHTPTLLFMTALMIAFLGGLLLFARGSHAGASATGLWGVAMLLAALGFVVSAVGQGVYWVADGVGTALFLAGASVSWTAARSFAGRPARPVMAAWGPVVWLLAVPIHPVAHVGVWLALSCALGVAYTLAAAWELWHIRDEQLPSLPAAIALLIVHAVIFGARGIDGLLGHTAGRWAEQMIVVLVLEVLLHTIGMAFMVIAMVKERIEQRTAEQLRALALQDGLTGIANRRHFDEHLDTEIRRARRLRGFVALLLIDVDHFKLFNDTYGHPEGDLCLRSVAATIAGLVSRPGDLAARFGGEEFAVLLPGTDLTGAGSLAESIRAAVQALQTRHDTPCGVVTVSVGVAAIRPGRDDDAKATLVAAADRALYQAKAAGRNRTWVDGLAAAA